MTLTEDTNVSDFSSSRSKLYLFLGGDYFSGSGLIFSGEYVEDEKNEAVMAERLRRWTRNPMGVSPRRFEPCSQRLVIGRLLL